MVVCRRTRGREPYCWQSVVVDEDTFMSPEHLALLQQAPASNNTEDIWGRMCCEQALLALEEGCYAVGAVLVNERQELLLGR